MKQRIPKKIHYCWFGDSKLPSLAKKCMDSWKHYLGDYEIKRWDESNFDISSYSYTKEAYEAGKFAFVSDYVRMHALYYEGGIYMDTDVEVVKNLDKFLIHEAFSGFESPDLISTGIIGSGKKHPWIEEILKYYRNISVDKSNSMFIEPNTVLITKLSLEKGLILNNQKQTFAGVTIYPKEYFCPGDYDSNDLKKTDNTHTIHHFAGSWLSSKEKLFLWFKKKILLEYLPFFEKPLQTFYRNYIK